MSGDTLVVIPATAPDDSVVWAKIVTAHDGQLLDSIRIRDPHVGFMLLATDDPNRRLMCGDTRSGRVECRLLDATGAELDRMDLGPLQYLGVSWLRGRGEMLIPSIRANGDVDLVRYRVEPSRIQRKPDTIVSRFQITGGYNVSHDGNRFSYALGPVQNAIWAIDLSRRSPKGFSGTSVVSSTTPMFARISHAGDKIFAGRITPGSDERSAHLERPRQFPLTR
jgi:hypothetical protein